MKRKRDKYIEKMTIVTASSEETFQVGFRLGQTVATPCIIALYGDLGVGKTTFIRGIASAVNAEAQEVCSPTFTYLNIYHGSTDIYHFDLYRIPTEKEFIAAGFDEYLNAGGICCIEWSEKIPSLLQEQTVLALYKVYIAHAGEGLREIKIV
jgi:tRNA threonylcarbamoyladenosine biosynthesis protein TsaE